MRVGVRDSEGPAGPPWRGSTVVGKQVAAPPALPGRSARVYVPNVPHLASRLRVDFRGLVRALMPTVIINTSLPPIIPGGHWQRPSFFFLFLLQLCPSPFFALFLASSEAP